MTTVPVPPGNALELSVAMHLSAIPFGPAVGPAEARTETFGVARVGTDVDSLVAAHGAVVACRQIGGASSAWQTIARFSLDVYAASWSAAWDAHNALTGHILRGPRPSGLPVRIDRITNESAGAQQPYPGAGPFVVTSLWRVSTRDLPA